MGFDTECAPGLEADLVRDWARAWGGESEIGGKAKLKLKTGFYFCPNGPVKSICVLSEIDYYFAGSQLPLVTCLDTLQCRRESM